LDEISLSRGGFTRSLAVWQVSTLAHFLSHRKSKTGYRENGRYYNYTNQFQLQVYTIELMLRGNWKLAKLKSGNF
jgi:hypothetical protein